MSANSPSWAIATYGPTGAMAHITIIGGPWPSYNVGSLERVVRIGVVADVHSNLPALRAVLDNMGTVDALWCLGDFVGYGPWPNECVELLRQLGVEAIAGNHDLAA